MRKTKLLSVYIPDEMMSQIKWLAEKDHRNIGSMVRKIIGDYIDANRDSLKGSIKKN